MCPAPNPTLQIGRFLVGARQNRLLSRENGIRRRNSISYRIVCPPALGRHPCKNRHILIDVIVDQHLALRVMQTMKPTSVLREGSLPRDRHREERRIETGVVKSLAQIATRRQEHALFAVGDARKPSGDVASLAVRLSTAKDDDILREAFQPRLQIFEMIYSFCYDNRRTFRCKRAQDIVEYQIIASSVRCDPPEYVLNRRRRLRSCAGCRFPRRFDPGFLLRTDPG